MRSFSRRALALAAAVLLGATSVAPGADQGSSVGRRVPNFVLPDSTGKQVALADFSDARFVVAVFVGTECPIGNAYVPDLNALQQRYRDRDVRVIGINANPSDDPESIAESANAPLAPAVPRDVERLEKAKHIPAIVVQGDNDGLVHGTRRWVEKMKEIDMEHRYIEVEGGDHVTVAWKHFEEIFEFFDAYPKAKSDR